MRINLALQGGGAHGAFTWGVCDRLLRETEIEIAGISGTSAGAMNGAAIKAGLAEGSRELARENLEWLWTQVSRVGDLRLTTWMQPLVPGAAAMAAAIESSPAWAFWDAASRAISPYAYGPFYRNPLRPIAERFRFDAVRAAAGPALYVGATNVRTGKIRVFGAEEVTPDVLLASACLPTLVKAVDIDGEAYWDGGYTGNPALFPLFDPALPDDIVIVNINPLERDALPVTPHEIQNRINEISFNTSLLRELRAIEFVQRLISSGRVGEGVMKRVLVHMVSDDHLMRQLSVATKTVPNPVVIHQLRAAGAAAARGFLDRDFGAVGERSTIDLPGMFA